MASFTGLFQLDGIKQRVCFVYNLQRPTRPEFTEVVYIFSMRSFALNSFELLSILSATKLCT